ncbi:MAG: alpha-amylase family glycosyl hydrolase [Eubacteriales bacterium]|nr:alpha-amylase family glycosyl hydrolase [Eubacteriales bacterium]
MTSSQHVKRVKTLSVRTAGFLAAFTVLFFSLTSCGETDIPAKVSDNYRNYYEIFVRSFYDSDGDGIGDIKGVTSKLDYISKDLGADGIWLMPVMPSPTYHKYDVKDYYAIDPQYGTLDDFEELIAEADERDVKIIIDLVVNHTSNLHPWFSQAVDALWTGEDSKYIDYYNFTLENPGQGFNKITDKYFYECRFVSGMPDLNLDNEEVRTEILDIARFWLDKGVGGFRLDAVTSFYTGNTTENVEFLRWLCDSIREQKSDAYIVGEVWSDGGTIANYYESGIDSLFNFAFSQPDGKIVKSLNSSGGDTFVNGLVSWQETIRAQNPEAIDALFLSNHDNARSAGFLMRDLARQKMAASMYLLAPGNPFIYYGEEIGMNGSGIDENKRLPMLWSSDSTEGMPFAPPNATQSVTKIEGVLEQLADRDSLLNHYAQLLRIKAVNPEIARGDIRSFETGMTDIAAFSVTYIDKTVYIFHNLSEEERSFEFSHDTDSKPKVRYTVSVEGTGKAILKDDRLTLPPLSSTVVR